MSSINVPQKKRGRPATGISPRIGVRLSPDVLAAMDEFMANNHEAGFKDKSDLLRTIITDWLIGAGYLPPEA